MPTHELILLQRTEHGWIATDIEEEIASGAQPTRQGALNDLDENRALASDRLELAPEYRDTPE